MKKMGLPLIGIWLVMLVSFYAKDSLAGGLAKIKALRDRKSALSLTSGRKPVYGVDDAKFVIFEFSDYQCPFCRLAEPELKEFANKHPNEVSIYRYNYPLEEIHPYARLAAIASICAEEQGISAPFQRVIWLQKDLKQVSWGGLAKESGVPNLERFAICLSGVQATQKLSSDVAVGKRYSVEGTPTFLINDKIVVGGMTQAYLEGALRESKASVPWVRQIRSLLD